MRPHPWQVGIAFLGLFVLDATPARAQSVPRSSNVVVIRPDASTVERQTIGIGRRRPWRNRNPYYVARPTYQPIERGARSSVTFAPFTSLYDPKPESYYPPVDVPVSRLPR